jgi:hypothetical protein
MLTAIREHPVWATVITIGIALVVTVVVLFVAGDLVAATGSETRDGGHPVRVN